MESHLYSEFSQQYYSRLELDFKFEPLQIVQNLLSGKCKMSQAGRNLRNNINNQTQS